ncbi:hypothetical protein EDC04DRAFT_2600414 [Pisolithus marmoratus]|nr:hypothetical protein EDC04DRAFT_2600414 [Pisolithus marmoratus]
MGGAALCRGLHLCLVGQQRRHGHIYYIVKKYHHPSTACEEIFVHSLSHTPNNTLGPYQVQSKPDGLNVHGDHRTGLVDQPRSSHVFAGYASVPAQATSLPDWCSDRRIRHYPNTPYAASSDTINVATGQVKVVNEASQTNPSAGHKKKSRIDEYGNSAPKQFLYRDADGKRCSQAVTCAIVSKYFITE